MKKKLLNASGQEVALLGRAIKWSNDMVTAYDEGGCAIPELCKPYKEIYGTIMAMHGDHTVFEHGYPDGRTLDLVLPGEW